MPIFKGDNWQHLYKGDGHPAALYKGSKKLAGWTEESQAGVSHAYFDDTYNDKADVVIHGKSSQVVTTGAQLWQNIKSGIASGVTITILEDGWINLNGTCTESNNVSVSSISLETGEYTLSIEKIGSFPDNNNSLVQVYSQDTGGILAIGNNYSVLFDSSQLTGANDYQYRVRLEGGFSYNDAKIRVMLQKGNEVTPWDPYTGGAPSPSPDFPQEITSAGDSGSIEVVSTGENLYAGGDVQGITKESTKRISVPCPGAPLIIKAVFVPVSGEPGSYVGIEYYDSENKRLGVNGYSTKIGIQNKDFVYHAKGLNANDGVSIDMTDVRKIDFIFSLNSVSGEYDVREVMVCTDRNESEVMFSGYQSSTATFSTPNGLPGIPVDTGGNYTDADGQQWICDEIDTKAGVYRQRVGKVQYIGDSSETWGNYVSEKYRGFRINLADRKIADFNHGICNRFPVDMNVNSTNPGLWIGSTSSSDISATIYFHNCNPSVASSVDEWRTWLSTHPVTIIYPLATPVETPLSDAVDTFLGGTNLFISEHEMDVTLKTEDQANPTGA